jgi:hypothetical protein
LSASERVRYVVQRHVDVDASSDIDVDHLDLNASTSWTQSLGA